MTGSLGGAGLAWEYMKLDRSKKKGKPEKEFPGTAEDFEKKPGWKETTRPEQRKEGTREFENPETGEKIRFDKGNPNKPGHGQNDHYHKTNPNAPKGRAGDFVRYLDYEGNPVPDGSNASHLYPPDGIFWQ